MPWRTRRIYERASRAYERGFLEGLAGQKPREHVYPGFEGVAIDHGRRDGLAYQPEQWGGPETRMPTHVWAEVLAEAQRPD
jgi:hypothetical protein